VHGDPTARYQDGREFGAPLADPGRMQTTTIFTKTER
jgi:hypothetical protein